MGFRRPQGLVRIDFRGILLKYLEVTLSPSFNKKRSNSPVQSSSTPGRFNIDCNALKRIETLTLLSQTVPAENLCNMKASTKPTLPNRTPRPPPKGTLSLSQISLPWWLSLQQVISPSNSRTTSRTHCSSAPAELCLSYGLRLDLGRV